MTGLSRPVGLAHAADSSGRLFVVEQAGLIKIVDRGRVLPAPFLDVRNLASELTSGSSERGLLGLAFHPRFGENGFFYVNYTDKRGDTHIVRYTAVADRTAADPGSARTILSQAQPFANHNGGQLAFGPDGYLYIGLGDGASANDPQGNAQNLGTLLGKLLRLDVDVAEPYATPGDNPFRNRADARPEIWAYGLRNPWRFSFDRATGDLFIADVGQNAWEEIDVQPPGVGGANYGWKRMEGAHCRGATTCDTSGLAHPAVNRPGALPAGGTADPGGLGVDRVPHHQAGGWHLFKQERGWRPGPPQLPRVSSAALVPGGRTSGCMASAWR